jgi:hypothetical protein
MHKRQAALDFFRGELQQREGQLAGELAALRESHRCECVCVLEIHSMQHTTSWHAHHAHITHTGPSRSAHNTHTTHARKHTHAHTTHARTHTHTTHTHTHAYAHAQDPGGRADGADRRRQRGARERAADGQDEGGRHGAARAAAEQPAPAGARRQRGALLGRAGVGCPWCGARCARRPGTHMHTLLTPNVR